MYNRKYFVLALLFLAVPVMAQEIYGVFGLPSPNIGHRQVGTIDQSNGTISLLGTNTSVETGTLAMTTGATALNVNGNRSYFIARNASNEDRIYTVDLDTGATVTNPILTAGYTTSNNWGVWYDEPNGVLYGLFDRGVNIEIATIDTTTGTVTPHHSNLGANGLALGSGLMSGDAAGNRIFVIIEASLYVVDTSNTDTHYELLLEDFWEEYTPSNLFGVEWDSNSQALWLMYNPGGGARKVIGWNTIEDGGEPQLVEDIELEFGDPITTASGLTTFDSQTRQFFFIGRPNGGAWSMFSVITDPNNIGYTITNIEQPSVVQTNGYQGIEVLPGPQLSMSKTDGDVSAIPGDTITYTLDYSNAPGTGATTGLTITETVPNNTTFLPGSSTADWSCVPDNNVGSVCTLTPAQLPPGGNGQATFAVQVVSHVTAGTTQISNTASITANNTADVIPASDDTPITAAATLSLIKTDGDVTNTAPGDSITYSLELTNTGNEIADQTVITETVPVSTVFNAAASFPLWNCADVVAGSLCTLQVGSLGGSVLQPIDFVVDVIPSVPAGTTEISNQASAQANNAPQVMAADTTPIVSAAFLSLTKDDGGASIEPGQSVIYTLNYGNSGNQDAANVVIQETILDQTTFDAANSSPGWVCVVNDCNLDLGTLAGGSSGSVDFALSLNDPVDALITELDNNATITADNAADVPANDTTPVVAAPSMRLVKSDGGIMAGLDRVINYTLIYFNDGNREATSATLTETVPDYTTFYPPGSSPGWQCVPDHQAGSQCTLDLASLNGHEKGNAFFAVRTDDYIFDPITELSNTATLDASNAPSPDSDTVLTPIDRIKPRLSHVKDNSADNIIPQCWQYGLTTNQLKVTLHDDQAGFEGLGDINNYALVNAGDDSDIQTLSCDLQLADDTPVPITQVTVLNNSDTPEIVLDLGVSIESGVYALLLCDGITDIAGNNFYLGDSYYWDNDHLIHPFRIDLENLFEYAYFDECGPIGMDPPPPLGQWQLEGDMNASFSRDSDVDFNDAFISQSMKLSSPNGSDVGASQCHDVNSGWPYRVGTQVLSDLSQTSDGTLTIQCDSSSQADCSDVIASDSVELTQAAMPGIWQPHEGILWTDPAAVAARCSVKVSNATEPVMIHMDEFYWQDADSIFEDGFDGSD